MWLDDKFDQPMIACHKSGTKRRRGMNTEDHAVFELFKNYRFNAGFFVIGKQHLNDYKVYNDLVSIVKKRAKPGQDHIYNDQDAVVEYWVHGEGTKHGFYAVPSFYNYREFGVLDDFSGDKLLRQLIDETKIIHYSGKRKPWGNITDRSKDNGKYDVCSVADPELMNDSIAMDIWHTYHKECFGNHCKTDWYKVK